MKWIHLSRFLPSTTSDRIVNHISAKINLDKELIKCFPLIKKDVDTSTLKFINFKLGVPSDMLGQILDPAIWPAGLQISIFRNNVSKNAEARPHVQIP